MLPTAFSVSTWSIGGTANRRRRSVPTGTSERGVVGMVSYRAQRPSGSSRAAAIRLTLRLFRDEDGRRPGREGRDAGGMTLTVRTARLEATSPHPAPGPGRPCVSMHSERVRDVPEGHMTSSPQSWFCDKCGEPVTTGDVGQVVWQVDPSSGLGSAYEIIHKTCNVDNSRRGYELDSVLGADGLSKLLAELSSGPFKRQPGAMAVGDVDSYVDVLRRLHILQYEEARRRFGDSSVQDFYGAANEYMPYLQSELKAIARRSLDD
jgi:hypothetical protein